MIAVDTNLLVYAHREDSPFHGQALAAMRRLAKSGSRWAIPWPCVHEFLAIVTHPRIFLPPSPAALALRAAAVWLDSPGCETLAERPGYYDVLQRVVKKAKITGPMVHDARIAALCIHHRVLELWTADRDFSRFTDLRTRNPMDD